MTAVPIHFQPVGTPRVVQIAGDLTSTTVGASHEFLERAVSAIEDDAVNANTLQIELLGARIIDSVGLNTLIGAIKRVRAVRGLIVIVVGTASARRILTFARLDRVVRLEGGA
jgi:anti-anti-sigma factor